MVAHTLVPLEISSALRPLETTNIRQGDIPESKHQNVRSGLASRQVAVRTVPHPAPSVEPLASHQERWFFSCFSPVWLAHVTKATCLYSSWSSPYSSSLIARWFKMLPRLDFTRSVALSARWSGCPAMAPVLLEPSSAARSHSLAFLTTSAFRFALMRLNKTSTGTAKEFARSFKTLKRWKLQLNNTWQKLCYRCMIILHIPPLRLFETFLL